MLLPKVKTPEWDKLKERYLASSKVERIALAKELGYKDVENFRRAMYYRRVRKPLSDLDKILCPFYGKADSEIGVSISPYNVEVTNQEKIDYCTKCKLRRCINEDDEEEDETI